MNAKRKPPRAPMPAVEEIWAYKRGEDRDGRPRTWLEVGAWCERDHRYVERIAKNRIYVPPDVLIDPRDYRPQLRDSLTDQDVASWQQAPYCLCGCGEPTLKENNVDAGVPYGAYRLFRRSHEARMPWRRQAQGTFNKSVTRRARTSASLRERTIRADAIVELMVEWRRVHGHTSWVPLAQRSGVTRGHLNDFVSGRYRRMSRLTAGKILVALGEPLRPEIATVYKAWAEANGLPHDKVRSGR